MAGTIAADTLTHSTAGSLTTDYVVNGSAKAWASTNQTSTQSNRDSFNVASITDGGVGVTTLAFTNSMNNANYSATGQEGSTNTTGFTLQIPYSTAANTSSQYAFVAFNGGRTAAADASVVSSAVHGDLA
jgi:hypothetical protein